MDADNNMKLLSSVQHTHKSARKSKKCSKKSKPVKVVYISNPMKIKTSASQFRALVQELTGRDSKLASPTEGEGYSTAQIEGSLDLDADQHHRDDQVEVISGQLEQSCESNSNSSTTTTSTTNYSGAANTDRYEMFENDDVFTPQVMEGFSGILPSNMWYESPHVQLCD